jgi:hypothetical protein
MKTFKEHIFEESKIPPENKLYGTPRDPRLDIKRSYKTSIEDPLMSRVMSSSPVPNPKKKESLSKEERARRKLESTLASNKRLKGTGNVYTSESERTGPIRTLQQVGNILGGVDKKRVQASEKNAFDKIRKAMASLGWTPENIKKD